MAAPSWAPSVSDVAAHVAQRVMQADGTTQGTFGSLTIPTDIQVGALIDTACQDVIVACGTIPTAPVDLTDAARAVAAIGAAALVELGFFANGAETAAYQELKTRYDDGLARLAKAVGQIADHGEIDVGDIAPEPVFDFGTFDLGSYIVPPRATTWGTPF